MELEIEFESLSPDVGLFYTCKPRIMLFSPTDFSNLFKFRDAQSILPNVLPLLFLLLPMT